MRVGERLWVGDVNGCANMATVEGLEQRGGIDNGTTGGVDEKRALFHEGQLPLGDEAGGFAGEGDDEDNDVGGGQEFMQTADAVDAIARGAGDADEIDAERAQAVFNGAADGAIADDETRCLCSSSQRMWG